MRVIITIDDVSHIAVHSGKEKIPCESCSLYKVCIASTEGLCNFFELGWEYYFKLLIPETKSKEDDKGRGTERSCRVDEGTQ